MRSTAFLERRSALTWESVLKRYWTRAFPIVDQVV